MKTMRDRAKEDSGMQEDAAGNLFPNEISWLKLSQGSRKFEMIQLFPGHYGIITMMVAAAGVPGEVVSI